MFGYNLRTVGKNKVVVPLILITLVGNGILRRFIESVFPGIAYDFFIDFFIANLICGLILAFPVWNKYLVEFPNYIVKKIWWLLLAVVVLYGGLLVGYLILSNIE